MSDDGRATYVMIGGFLGAGKTTAVARMGEALTARGLRPPTKTPPRPARASEWGGPAAAHG